ncbi:hypothetical protein BJ980_002374 [Nocardioides daedukensis]|uniref:WD40 repeat domain-containing protein n=1 Tax=Nocardioides daedukensis TaxID=634462 RepID=A0A7Y9RZD5_9ACTN|nr:hypothetical protein [Nocardioides daedukensis]NYG59451.1 hypothetical protein [Nocardioides daedukensis]
MNDISGERRLRDALEDRSDVMSDSVLDLGAVHQQATGIRRRRRIGTGLTAAAVVAVIAVPLALVLPGGDDRGAPPPAVQPTSGSTSGTPTPPSPGSAALLKDAAAAEAAIEAVERGEDPYIEHSHDGELMGSDGSYTQLPAVETNLEVAGRFRDGMLVLDDTTLTEYDSEGMATRTLTAGGTVAINAEGSQMAWFEIRDGRGTLVVESVDPGVTIPEWTSAAAGVTYGEPVGFTSDGGVVAQVATTDGPGVQVFREGREPQPVEGILTAGGVDPVNGRLAGHPAGNEDAAAAMLDLVTGEVLWEKAGWRLGRFSPDGNHVIGLRGAGNLPTVAILDAATGEVVREIEPRKQLGADHTSNGIAWEGNDTVLIVVHVVAGTDAEDHAGTVLRFDTSGKLERAADVEDGARGSWVFGPRP